MIQQSNRIRRQLRHRQNRRIGNPRKSAHRQTLAQFRTAMPAKVGDNRPHPGQVLDHRPPVFVVKWCGVKKDHRQTAPGVPKRQPRSVRFIPALHTIGGYAPGSGGLFGNPDPAGKIRHTHKTARKEESQHRDNPDNGHIPAVGLRQRQAHTGDLAAHNAAAPAACPPWPCDTGITAPQLEQKRALGGNAVPQR